jgi:hypothetical protein
VSKKGPDFNASMLAQSEDDEHAASVNAQPTITRTRFIMLSVPPAA